MTRESRVLARSACIPRSTDTEPSISGLSI
jgi:hypothetical protein